MEDDSSESYEGQVITPQQARQILSKKYWNYEKISAWVETLPQIQEKRRQEKTDNLSTAQSQGLRSSYSHYEEED